MLEFLQSDAAIAGEVEAGDKQVEESFRQVMIRGQINQAISANKDFELMAQVLTNVFMVCKSQVVRPQIVLFSKE